MADSKHTPGPWEWKDDDREKFGHYRLHPGVLATQLTDGTPWGDDIDRANARLIAAAPDLLEALQNAAGFMDTPISRRRNAGDGFYEETVRTIRAAIAKATGAP